MNLDIRTPIGLMFLTIGALLAVYGLVTNGDDELYARSLAVNVNLWWGLVMLIFGAAMFFAARRGNVKTESAAGIATEEREHALGLESENPK